MHRLLAALACALLLTPPATAQQAATFEDLPLGQSGYENGQNLSGSFTSSGVTFRNNYAVDPQYGPYWSGWAYSNVYNTTTPGFGNQYAAYVPGAAAGEVGSGGSEKYGIANPGNARVTLPAGTLPVSIDVTNTTYAALSMLQGDSFAKKFGGPTGNDPDWFKLTVTGYDGQNAPTGTVDFFLADFTAANNALDYIVDDWTTVPLTSLPAGTQSLGFRLTSSDVGQFGMNTPAYFAADNLVVAPEPLTTGLIAAGGLAAAWRWRRRRCGGE